METNFNFKIWKTITLGIGPNEEGPRTGGVFVEAMVSAGFQRDAGNASACLRRLFVPHPSVEEVDLVALQMHQVGYLPSGEEATDLTACAIEFDGVARWAKYVGLEPCPMEVGPQLRLQYPEQPEGEECVLFMEPVKLGQGPRPPHQIFYVCHRSVLNSHLKPTGRFAKSLELGYVQPFRDMAEASCSPGCENFPVDKPRLQFMIFVKPRR